MAHVDQRFISVARGTMSGLSLLGGRGSPWGTLLLCCRVGMIDC